MMLRFPSETTMPLYSEGYSAPELILGKNITEKCDYYSIGIIMSEILLSQKNGSDINSRIEEWTGRKEIKDILLSLVQEKPENRPESLENVIVILERLIGNLNTSSCSYIVFLIFFFSSSISASFSLFLLSSSR